MSRQHLLRSIAIVAMTLLVASCGDNTEPVSTGDTAADGTDTTANRTEATVPGRAPDMTGVITSVAPFVPVTEDCVPAEELDPDGSVSSEDPPVCTPEDMDLLGTVVVEEQPAVQEGRKISLSITAETVLAGDGLAEFDDFAEGQTIEVWTGDVCAESYPEQCGGVAVRATG